MPTRSFLLQEGWRVYELSRGHNRLDLDVKGAAYLSRYECHSYYEQMTMLTSFVYYTQRELGPASIGVTLLNMRQLPTLE
jgi:hypothetical protein